MKNKISIICPICKEFMTVGKVDEKVVACCINKKCESVLVFGEQVQKAFKKL